jgi:hypothetical protein
MSAANPPRFERKQVVKNLSLAFGGIVRGYLLGLREMIFEGNEPNGVIRDAILDALSQEGIDLDLTADELDIVIQTLGERRPTPWAATVAGSCLLTDAMILYPSHARRATPRKIETKDDLDALASHMGSLIGSLLDQAGISFTLLMVPFGGPGEWCSYISNSQRDDIIKMLRQTVEMLERTTKPQGAA